MSTDASLRQLSILEKRIPEFRALPNLYTVIAIPEGPGFKNETLLSDLIEHVNSHYSPHKIIQQNEMYGYNNDRYALVILDDFPLENDNVVPAFYRFNFFGQELTNVLKTFPAPILHRLGIRFNGYSIDEWIRILFHLVWHFPTHFPGLRSERYRLRNRGGLTTRIEEFGLQLWRDDEQMLDQYPGLIFSALIDSFDLVSVTERAIDLLKIALRPVPELQLTDEISTEFRKLKHEFDVLGSIPYRTVLSRPNPKQDVVFLRLASSFETPPAKEWSDFVHRHDQSRFILSRRNAVKEFCAIQGPAKDMAIEILNRAGAFLPYWPVKQHPTVIEDAYKWRERVRKLKEFSDEQWDLRNEDGSTQQITPELKADIVRQHWHTMHSPTDKNQLVTDDRGNVERWIGFVFDIIKENMPEEIELTIFPPDVRPFAIAPWNAQMTFKTMNIFQASSKAIEYMNLLPNRPLGQGEVDSEKHPMTEESSKTGVPKSNPGQSNNEEANSNPSQKRNTLLNIYTNRHFGEKYEDILRIAPDPSLTVDQKLDKIDGLVKIPPTTTVTQLAELLGVTKQAIHKSDWWQKNRNGEKKKGVGLRKAQHIERAELIEKPKSRDNRSSTG